MAGVRQKPKKSGKYQGWYTNCDGKRVFFTGTKKRKQTLQMAERLEDEHRQIRLGYRPRPKQTEQNEKLPFEKVRKEYIEWGEKQGGKRGGPWGVGHANNRRRHLKWWGEQLGLDSVGDLNGSLLQIEKALNILRDAKRTPKTLANYLDSLMAFCAWCIERDLLTTNPVKKKPEFDTTPKSKRRAMTEEELQKLLEVAPANRKLLYELAAVSGLRANELRHLEIKHLDVQNSGLRLDAEWTKNRKEGFQALPKELANRLEEHALSGKAAKKYEQTQRRKNNQRRYIPEDPLLFVPIHLDRDIRKDFVKAGIPKVTDEGYLDFHALRVTFINMVIDSGANVKEAQELARHSTPTLTMNVYGRTRKDKLSEKIELVSTKLRTSEVQDDEECALCVHPPQKPGGLKQKTHRKSDGLLCRDGRDLNPRPPA